MAALKLAFGNEMRRLMLSQDQFNQAALKGRLASSFGDTIPQTYILQYVDEDGDLISIRTDEELRETLQQHVDKHSTRKALRLAITPQWYGTPPSSPTPRETNTNTDNDGGESTSPAGRPPSSPASTGSVTHAELQVLMARHGLGIWVVWVVCRA